MTPQAHSSISFNSSYLTFPRVPRTVFSCPPSDSQPRKARLQLNPRLKLAPFMICLPRCRIKPTWQCKALCVMREDQLNRDMPTCPCPTPGGWRAKQAWWGMDCSPAPSPAPHLRQVWLLAASSCNYDAVSHRTWSLSLESKAGSQSLHTNLSLTVQNPPLTNTEKIICQKMLTWIKNKKKKK